MSSRRYTKSLRGLTLVELVIVILIIGILTGVATPKFASSLKRAQADAAALRVKADLNLARQTAISRSATQSVQFAANSAVYTLPGIAHPDHPAATYSVNLADASYRAVVTAASFGAGTILQFDRYGQPINAGSVTISAGGITKTVTVDATTGVVSAL